MNAQNNSGGTSFLALLTLLFVGLKLGSVIAWPWAWVLAPLWIPVAVVVVLFVLTFIVIGIKSLSPRTA